MHPLMEDQVTLLYNKAYTLMHLDAGEHTVYADDFTRLNREIYTLIQTLWNRRGNTVEEEAWLCLSLLMGFRVCMYCNVEDERKRRSVEDRVKKILKANSESQSGITYRQIKKYIDES